MNILCFFDCGPLKLHRPTPKPIPVRRLEANLAGSARQA
jgi:hypothetical protein